MGKNKTKNGRTFKRKLKVIKKCATCKYELCDFRDDPCWRCKRSPCGTGYYLYWEPKDES